MSLYVVAAPVATLPPVGTHRRPGSAREHDTLHGKQLLGARLLARMAPLVQSLDRALPLHPTRRRAEARSYQRPDIYVRRALARLESKALGVGLARGAFHPAGGRREEDTPSVAGTCPRAFPYGNNHNRLCFRT